MKQTYRQKLWDQAVGRYGYITTADAHALGIPVVELGKLAARGRLRRVGHTVYRFEELPVDPVGRYLEAVLLVGPGARLVGDAVLALHELALVNPRRITVGLPRRSRAALPDWVRVVHDVTPQDEVVLYEGIPATTVEVAIRACIGTVMRDRLREAVDAAERQGLVLPAEAAKLRHELGETP
jgi:predicted transcriptional regulator of viral defense system